MSYMKEQLLLPFFVEFQLAQSILINLVVCLMISSKLNNAFVHISCHIVVDIR